VKPQIILFAAATLAPVPLLVAGALSGAGWLLAALGYMTVFVFALDRLSATANPDPGPDPGPNQVDLPAADALSALLAVLHFALLALAVWAVAGAGNLTGWERLAAFFAFGLYFGQVSNSNAHELIHRTHKPLFELGKWVFISHLFGHHTSAHRLVHHRHAATAMDPNTARPGESFYHFAPRAWLGSFRAGLRAENARAHTGLHPYAVYLGGAALVLLASALIAGAAGVAAHLALAAYATAQILLSDYVQHYGLQRQTDAQGKPEPIGPRHSWNARHWFSSLVMLNAPRHSDHHAHPARPYPALRLPEGAPMLPRSLPVMGIIALTPRHWRKIMDARLSALQNTTT
jgi:alkane 1-monooxygenase